MAREMKNKLAMDGGTPVRTATWPFWPHFADDEIAAATAVLRSGRVNYWTGDEAIKFEQEFAAFCRRRHAVAVANGTLALELALYALGIGPGDEVIVPSRTFIATASAAVARGARPVVADLDPFSQTITAETIAPLITPKTKAVIAVHLAGWPCDMDPILELASRHGFLVVEDCAQAHGAVYKGRPVGSLGHIAAFSFCQDKIITTAGEGGMVVMDDSSWWEKAWSYKDHGKSYQAVYKRQHPQGARWVHESFGTNWRLTEPQAAIGRVQLGKLESWVEIRRRNAALLTASLNRLDCLSIAVPPDDSRHAYYKYLMLLNPDRLQDGWSRDRIAAAVEMEGIPCWSGSSSEIYLEKAFPEEWRPRSRLPVAKSLGENSLMLQVHPTLTEADMSQAAEAVEKVMAVSTL